LPEKAYCVIIPIKVALAWSTARLLHLFWTELCLSGRALQRAASAAALWHNAALLFLLCCVDAIPDQVSPAHLP
ncbi:MAG: hypothetical protein Q4A97_00955, partial [Comamonadaceae bacterium]|nr:hypothetical protein [Comamonadaceae bacterium]